MLATVRIGELSERTGVSRRSLRYYEEQGLVVPVRGHNGYREYEESHVDIVFQIRGLLEAGLPTRIIEQLLPCLAKPQTIYASSLTPEMIATLQLEQARLSERIECLVRHRDAVGSYLERALALKLALNDSENAAPRNEGKPLASASGQARIPSLHLHATAGLS